MDQLLRPFGLQGGNFLEVRQLDPVRFLSIDHTGVALTLLGHLNVTVIKVLFNPFHESESFFGIAHFFSVPIIRELVLGSTNPGLQSDLHASRTLRLSGEYG